MKSSEETKAPLEAVSDPTRERGGLLRQARVSDQPPCLRAGKEPFPRNVIGTRGATLPVPDSAVCRQESELGFESPRGRRLKETHGEQGRGRRYPRKGRPGNGQRSGAMSFVLVVDQERRPQSPVHPGTARW